MTNLLLFTLFALFVFFLSLIGYKKFLSTALYALAIGGVVNSLYFTSNTHPIDIFGMNFGIDSIIYALFLFAVILMYLRFSKKDAIMLGVSSSVAILFAACMELVAVCLSNNITPEAWNKFYSFCFTTLATVIAFISIIFLIDFLKKKTKLKNEYLILIIGMVVGSFLNSFIYFSLYGLISNLTFAQINLTLITLFIGKGISILVGLLVLFVMNLIDKIRAKK